MTIRSRRRQLESDSLETMTDEQLSEIFHFGNLAVSPGVLSFVATEPERSRACEILNQRNKRVGR